jgi:hypothetical protein
MTRRSALPVALVSVVALAYPLGVVAGGAPSFPSRADCIHRATADGDLEVVFGYSDSEAQAQALLTRVLAVGFKGSQIERNACGQVKVAVHGIPTLKVGGQVMTEARSVGLQPTLERVS